MKQDEFRSRYLIKISSSVLIAALNMVIQVILPRAFTVEEYGYYSYNLNVFTSIVGMAMLSIPNALVSKYSKRNEEIGLVLFYLKFYLAMALVLNILIIVLYSAGFLESTFAGQTLFVVLLGMEASLVLRLQTDSIGIFDAMAVSRFPAVMQILLKAFVSAAVLVSYFLGRLNLVYFYIMQILITFTVVFCMIYEMIKEQRRRYPIVLNHGNKVYFKEFFRFCKPLVISNLVSQLIVIFMNWALMNWSGVVEQAMFGVAWQLNTLVSYVFSPYAAVSKREFALLQYDMEGMRHRYIQSLKLMMWITSYFAVFIGFASVWILPIVYGDKYAGATFVTILIMFYTIYQAWGQISGSFQIATERTKVSAVLGVAGQIETLILVFIFQIPNFLWPEGLGSTGIALTYFLSNFISVSMSIYVDSRILKMEFLKNFSIQILPLTLCSGTIIILRYLIDGLYQGYSAVDFLGKVLIAGSVYTAVIGTVIWRNPQLLGIKKESLRAMVKFGQKHGRDK